MPHRHQIRFAAPSVAPTIEHDPSIMGWYIRFSSRKVVRTTSVEGSGVICAIDLDAGNQVIGVELLGIREFTIRAFRAMAAIDSSKVDFERARWRSAASCQPVAE